jgi:taurine dioxygenase
MNDYGLGAIEAWNSRPRRHYETITVKPLTHTIGAEISGKDLSTEPSGQQSDEIRHSGCFIE